MLRTEAVQGSSSPCSCLPGVPKGLEPDNSQVPYNACTVLIQLYMQKLASQTKKRKVNFFEQKKFLFLQATPAYKPSQSREGSSSFPWQTDGLSVYQSGSLVRQEACAPWPGDLSAQTTCSPHESSRICRTFLQRLTHHHEDLPT